MTAEFCRRQPNAEDEAIRVVLGQFPEVPNFVLAHLDGEFYRFGIMLDMQYLLVCHIGNDVLAVHYYERPIQEILESFEIKSLLQ